MKSRMGIAAGLTLLAGCAQALAASPRPAASRSAPEPTGSAEILREIVDPFTGDRWLLERDADHPGGPARLAPAGKAPWASAGPAPTAPGGTAGAMTPEPRVPVIRVGDAILLTVHTSVMDARLEAVALTPAAPGSRFRARLRVGGKQVEAIALGPGRAQWAWPDGVRP